MTSPDDAGLTKSGTGTLTLANAANDYVGPTAITGGVLSVGTLADGGTVSGIGASSSASSNLLLSGGATLQYTGATTTTDRGFTLGPGGGGFDVTDAGTTLTVSGTGVGPAGSGALIKNGAGTLVLSGTNTYTGGNIVNAGTLQAGSLQALGATNSPMTVNAGATFDVNGFALTVGALRDGADGGGSVLLGSQTLTLSGNNGSFSGDVSGTGGLLIGNTQTMTGCGNTYTGPATITGTLNVDCLANGGQASGIGASASDPTNLVLTGFGTLNYTGPSVTIDRGFNDTSIGGARSSINVTNVASTLELTGEVTGNGAWNKRGAGTLMLSGNNTTFGGSITVDQGVLRAGSSTAFGNAAISLSDVAGATLDINNLDASVRSLSGGGTTGGDVTLGSGTLTIADGSNQTYTGAISGSGGLTTAGSSTQSLSGCDSSYTGATTVRGGILAVTCLADGGSNSSIGAATSDAGKLVLDGGTLRYVGSGDSTDRLFTLGPSAASALDATGTGAVAFTNTGAIAFSSPDTAQTVTLTGTNTDDNSLAALIGDNGTGKTSLSKTGAGTWILDNPASTYTGVTTITGGVLGVDHLADGGLASSIGASSNAASNLVLGNGATLRYTGTGDSTDRLFTLAAGTTAIESSGSGAINFTNTGTVTLQGTGPHTIGLGGTNTGTNIMGGAIADASPTTGKTTLGKSGPGTWVLTGDNTYSGDTVINDGNLVIGDPTVNGGTSGNAGTGDVILVNSTSTLSFNRSDTFNFDGSLSGDGNIAQIGAGTTVLTSTTSDIAGTTRVDAGTLEISGALTTGGTTVNGGTLVVDAGGTLTTPTVAMNTGAILTVNGTLNGINPISVGDGATLGGTGTIADSVTVADDGAIAPGDPGNVPGTLTITGDLALSDTSELDYDFGQAGVVGGAFNDLIDVGGDLTLDGTLNVTQSTGGTFGPGVYRIMNYTGSLTNNAVGVASPDFFVQTSIDKQVNLVNTAGLTLSFWDGDNGPKNNGVVDGGDGTWQNSAGNDNWTTVDGSLNAPYDDGAFAIFEGSAGTVTVDDGAGGLQPVTATGMQFASNGYIVQGDAITLLPESSGTSATMDVGDHTAGGAVDVATISSVLQGSVQLIKDDFGTLVLRGDNTYTGGTAIVGGTLSIASDANLGDAAGGLFFDGGTLENTAAFASARAVTLESGGGTFETDADLTLTGTIADGADPGALTKTGAGTLILTADETYTGGTTISAGTLQLGSGGAAGSVAGDITDNGTLAFDHNSVLVESGVISGSGRVEHLRGFTSLTGTNTYTGGTIISGGTLQVGGGSTEGSIVGDVTDNAVLAFSRSDDVTFGGTISGAGIVEQRGSGNLILTADNSYAGTTTVNGPGGLYVNGDQSAATGETLVGDGATLGGKGTIGGNVTLGVLAGSGTLSPGDFGAAPGTLTINGDLTVGPGPGSNFNYSFGQANVAGGPMNDLTIVHGNLAFNGVAVPPNEINVVTAPGGTFGPGIYRIFDYDGTLTGGANLALGTVPAGTDFSVQTSVDHQINLVNTAGLTLNFWDGDAGPKNDGHVDGGDGTWQVAGSLDDWTDAGGSANAPFTNGSFAIFEGAAGTVEVDNGNGPVTVEGMQFASDGYLVEGDILTLVPDSSGTSSTIEVGDNASDGASYVATINSGLVGASRLVKTDLGTLVLGGTNTYTGGTAIDGGTLSISRDANLGDVAGGLSLDGSTLETTADVTTARTVVLGTGGGTFLTDSGTTTTLNGPVGGSGALTKAGDGTLVIDALANYTGGTTISAGTLRLGAGGALGSIEGDVTDNATLAFDRSDSYTFAGLISGAGGVDQIGTGTTVLTGDNTYAGPTDVTSGTLLVDGDQSGAAGLTSVAGGATLGGTGTIGGDVIIADSGILSPGDGGNAAGALTINGDLTLGNGTILAYNFGQANAPGAPLNDVVNVGGDLKLDGTIDVTPTAGGSFGPGVYRVFNYNGSLNDGVLEVTSPNYLVQTSIDHQVNLINTAGQLLTFWDGDAGPKDNSVVDGGDGIWQVAGTSNNWTTPAGDVNAPFSNGGFAVFEGAPGTVTVDNGNGQVIADGMQFAADGYTITGEAIALVPDSSGVSSTIDVGDHASDGAAYVATIEADLTGASGLVKDDLGTLILEGDSTYTGTTTVAAGTLAAGRDGVFDVASGFIVQSASTLDLAGFDQTVASLANGGTVRLGAAAPGTVLTVTGDYVGNGGTIALNTALGDDSSSTDELVIGGSSTGTSTLAVTNVGGVGAQTTEGIKVVDVAGSSSGVFALKGDYVFQGDQAVVGGAYAYRLFQGGVSTPNDGDWYLRSALIPPAGPAKPLYQPGVPLYEAYANVLQSFNKIETLEERVGNRTWSDGAVGVIDEGTPDGRIEGNGVWGRIEANRTKFASGTSTTGTTHDDSIWRLQGGIDGLIFDSAAGRLIGGVSAQYGTITSEAASVFGSGSIASTAAGLGGTLTWYGRGGFYLDGQGQVTWYDSKLTSRTANLGLVTDNHGFGYGLSIEAGQKLALGPHWSVTPQAQLAYSSVDYDDFTDAFGAAVSLGNSSSLEGRLGISADYEQAGRGADGRSTRTHLYGIVNVYYDFAGASKTDVAGTSFANDNDPLWGGAGIGGSYNWDDDKYSVYGEASAVTSLKAFGKSYGIKATGGLRIKW